MSVSRAWLLIGIAGLLEVAWAMGLKYSEGFTRPWVSGFTLVTMAASMWLLAQGLKVLPAGTGYAVWTGIGAVGTAILGIVLLGESRSGLRLLCIGLIVAGIVGLRVAD